MSREIYEDPLVGRYTKEIPRIFGDDYKFRTWRRCWTALAEAQMELGVARITPAMIRELTAAQETIDYQVVATKELETRHDVIAHIYEYGSHCPAAKGAIHLGATSQFVKCNTDLIQMREAMAIIKRLLAHLIHQMSAIAAEHKGTVCLGYTHFQAAQPTTIGKRFTLYLQDLLMDLEDINALTFRARGAKGATGTQASYMELFGGDYAKAQALDALVAKKLGFEEVFPVTGQSYPRKFDIKVGETLAGIGVSLAKFSADMRLLCSLKCVDEPFRRRQSGSSAMPYKQNPIQSERLSSLAMKPRGLVGDLHHIAASQWFERTLDDSAARRMDIPQLFLLAEAMLLLGNDITSRNYDPQSERPLTFYPHRLCRLLREEMPFLASEAMLIDLVQRGYDRQEMREIIERHAYAAGRAIKEQGADNDLLARLADDPKFPLSAADLGAYMNDTRRFAGGAERQTEAYLREVVQPALARL